MKTVKLSAFILFTHLTLFSFSQKTTFTIDSLIIDRETYNIMYNRNNTVLSIGSDEKSKTIFIGILKNDSVHLHLKQGLIRYKSKKIPVLLYEFTFKDRTNSLSESREGMFVQYPNINRFSYEGLFDNLLSVYIKIKADPDNSNLLPDKDPASKTTFDITHRMEFIKIENKSFTSTSPVFSKNIENNKPTKKVKICSHNETDIFYTISVHTINTFPEFKIICINSDLEKDDNHKEHTNTYLMKGNRAESDVSSFSSFYIIPPDSKKSFMIRFKPNYTIQTNTL